MVYTVFYRPYGSDKIGVAECAGPDWWDALENGKIKEWEVVAMVPGQHQNTIMFSDTWTPDSDGAASPMMPRVVDLKTRKQV